MNNLSTTFGLEAASNLLEKLKLLLLHPVRFFESIDVEGRWLDSFLFLLPCLCFNALMNTVLLSTLLHFMASIEPESYPEVPSMGPGFHLVVFLIFTSAMIIGTFLMSLAVSVALHFLGGKGTFRATYRVLAFSWFILLISWIPFLGVILGLYFFVPAIIGLSRVHSVSYWRAFFGLCIGPLMFVAVSSICLFVMSNVAAFFIHPQGSNSPWNQDSELMRRYERK